MISRIRRWLAGPPSPVDSQLGVTFRPGTKTVAKTNVQNEAIWIEVPGKEYGNGLTIWVSAYDFGRMDDCSNTLDFLRSLRDAIDVADAAVCKAHSNHGKKTAS